MYTASESISNYGAICASRQHRWPESEFYASEKHRLVYCAIQKVACSSLKLWWAELEDGSTAPFTSLNKYGKTSINHIALDSRYKLHHQPLQDGVRPLTDDDWLRVVFVRNPWARLVSVFVNKFLPLHDLAKPVFMQAQSRWGNIEAPLASNTMLRLMPWTQTAREESLRKLVGPEGCGEKAWQDEFTFRHFIECLSDGNLDEDDVDLHWRPQYRFLGDVSFHIVGRFERLKDDFKKVTDHIDVNIDLPAQNRTSYTRSKWQWSLYSDWPLRKLRRLARIPNYRQFYTRKLRDQVADLYRRDIEQFGYEFDT